MLIQPRSGTVRLTADARVQSLTPVHLTVDLVITGSEIFRENILTLKYCSVK